MKSTIKLILVQFFIFCFLLFFLEIISTIIFFFHKGHTLYSEPRNIIVFVNNHLSKHHIENSVMKLKHYKSFDADLLIDNHGMISTVNNLQGDRAKKKLLLMGGSTVEGRGSSSNSTTIASYLSACLAGANMPMEVLNGGRSGQYSYTEYRILLESFLPKFKPEIVVQINGFNDFTFSLQNRLNEFQYHSDIRNAENLIYQDRYGIGLRHYLKDLFVHTHLYRIIISISNKINKPLDTSIYEKFIYLKDSDMEKRAYLTANHFKTQIANTKNIVESFGSNYVHFLQPTLALDKRKITDIEKLYLDNWKKRNNLKENFFIELNKFYEAYKNLNELSLDLSDSFNGLDLEQLYSDSIHYNDLSNKILANSICDYIVLNRHNFKSMQ